ncbi:MAG: transcriptional repressor [Saprospiraceae bacterium]|nr:transcriptional repressor [Saprospiraceae bacterium]
MDKALDILVDNGLRKTVMRQGILEIFLESDMAVSQQHIEATLTKQFERVDRITVYRTLKTFEQKGIIHKAIDGTHTPKYALCTDNCSEHAHHDAHAHFHCDDCGKTFCIEEVSPPKVNAPKGFVVKSTHLVMNGRCDNCQD